MSSPPRFWSRPSPLGTVLSPLGWAYSAIAARRMAREGRRVPVPVLCIGNPTVGGAGKTPTALALGETARRMGQAPGFLSRGYGRAGRGTVLVDPHAHDASAVGDEPLLLAALAPTVVARDRADGAKLLARQGVDLVIMDDGFQSRAIEPDLALLLVDGVRGVGNGRVLPAGPLRAPLGRQLQRADALLVVDSGAGAKGAGTIIEHAEGSGVRVLEGRIVAEGGEGLRGRDVFAFCGLADPEKFRRSLEAAGARVRGRRDFADHHPYTREEIERVLHDAKALGARPVTTAKDRVRIQGLGLAEGIDVLDIRMELAPEAAEWLVTETVRRGRSRLAQPTSD